MAQEACASRRKRNIRHSESHAKRDKHRLDVVVEPLKLHTKNLYTWQAGVVVDIRLGLLMTLSFAMTS